MRVKLVERCREHQPALPAFLITGQMDKLLEYDEKIAQVFSAILPKPLDIDRLMEEISHLR